MSRREAGFTFVEVMLYVVLFGAISTTVAGITHAIHRTDRATAAYVDDLDGLRRAIRLVENDLRHAKSVHALKWELKDGVLRRDGEEIARNIAAFDLDLDERFVTVTIAPGSRADVTPTRRPLVTTRVRLRRPR